MVTGVRRVGTRALQQAPRGWQSLGSAAVVVVGAAMLAAAQAGVIAGMFVAGAAFLGSSLGVAGEAGLQRGVQTLHLARLASRAARLGTLED